MDYTSRNKRACLSVKVDFQKPFDCASWNNLRFIMQRMNFGSKWLQWMDALVFTSFMSIIFNESPTSYFLVKRGLMQGDPLSPFLFLLAVECLVGLVQNASNLGGFQ